MYKRWRVYSTFLTGLCIGLGYAWLLGRPWSPGSSLIDSFIEWKVLVLAFSGILGGIIYSIVISGEIEMPHFVANQGTVFKAGLFGDIILGIAGAFILELLLPASLSIMEAEKVNSTAIAATGIIGGYGGRAILKFSLERFFKYAGGLDKVREAAMTGQLSRSDERVKQDRNFSSTAFPPVESQEASTETERSADEYLLSLIDQVDRYVQGDLPETEWVQFTQQMQAEPASVQQEVSEALSDLREAMAGSLSNEQLQRIAVLLNGLIGLSPDNHQLYQQLALVNKDLYPPAYEKALVALDKAIQLRGPLSIGKPFQYELHRAVVNIEQGQAATDDFSMPAATQEAILADLLTIARVYNLDTILQAADQQQIPTPIVNWIRHNQSLLEEREEIRPLLNSLRSIILGNRLRPIDTEAVDSNPTQANLPPTEKESENVSNSEMLTDTDALHSQNVVFPEIFSALGRCYDILYLDPFDILSDQSAKMTQVFDFEPQDAVAEQDEGKTILIPKGTRYTPGSSGRIHVSEQSNLLHTESDIQRMFAGTLGEAVIQLFGAVLPFSLSASYSRYKRERRTEKSVYAFTKAEYLHYTLDIDRQQSKALHLNGLFCQAVAQLPLTTDFEYFNFIRDFGTHAAIKVQFGGLFHHRYCLKQSSYASMVQSGGNVAIEAKRAFEAKYENKNQGSTFKEFSDSSEVFDFCGGMKKETIHDWFGTIKADPAPIHLELMPLYELLDSTWFPEDEQIIKKRSLLAAATQQYLEEHSDAIDWELWPSVAIGGNGGEAFSDIDLSPIWLEANKERYQHARVKEVRVWIKNWVEQVQMVLEGDMPPLQAHGDEEGDLKIFKLEPDDYITAFSVMSGAPQKILTERDVRVGFIRIQTYKGENWTVGTPDPSAISLDIPDGYQVIGFHGRCGKHIDKLGVISIPVAQ